MWAESASSEMPGDLLSLCPSPWLLSAVAWLNPLSLTFSAFCFCWVNDYSEWNRQILFTWHTVHFPEGTAGSVTINPTGHLPSHSHDMKFKHLTDWHLSCFFHHFWKQKQHRHKLWRGYYVLGLFLMHGSDLSIPCEISFVVVVSFYKNDSNAMRVWWEAAVQSY